MSRSLENRQWLLRRRPHGYDIDLRTGFDNVPDTFNCLFTGAHNGRLVVQIDDPNQSASI
jgi:NADPH-dependent curcumin reductase CurA